MTPESYSPEAIILPLTLMQVLIQTSNFPLLNTALGLYEFHLRSSILRRTQQCVGWTIKFHVDFLVSHLLKSKAIVQNRGKTHW